MKIQDLRIAVEKVRKYGLRREINTYLERQFPVEKRDSFFNLISGVPIYLIGTAAMTHGIFESQWYTLASGLIIAILGHKIAIKYDTDLNSRKLKKIKNLENLT